MERFGYCHLSIIPVRVSASHTSEMVTQLLFGEMFEILSEQDDFILIRVAADKYEGYISQKQFLKLSINEFEMLTSQASKFPVASISNMEELSAGISFPILCGSHLNGFSDGSLKIGGKHFKFKGEVQQATTKVDKEKLVATALQFLNAPYLWGGRSLFGIDCSGLMQVVFNIHGVALQRDAAYQSQSGDLVNLFSEATTGDLAFFDNDEGKITHVGMVIPDHKIIHASGMVRIDNLDHHGIYNQFLKKYTHKLRLVKRVI